MDHEVTQIERKSKLFKVKNLGIEVVYLRKDTPVTYMYVTRVFSATACGVYTYKTTIVSWIKNQEKSEGQKEKKNNKNDRIKER